MKHLRNKSILQQRTFPGKPVKRNSICHILHGGEKITQRMCLIGIKVPRFTRASRGNFRTCENGVRRRRLMGPSSFWIQPNALQFCFIWTSTKPLLKNLNSYCFLQLFQVDIFPSYKNQSESPFSFKLIDCLLYKEIFASNWLWSSSVKQKCLSLCNGGLCDVNSR